MTDADLHTAQIQQPNRRAAKQGSLNVMLCFIEAIQLQ